MQNLFLDEEFGMTFMKCYRETFVDVKKFVFSGGEINITLSNITSSYVKIFHRITDARHIMELFLTVDALRRNGVTKIDLFLPYIPYARQDRVCNEGEALSLKVFASMINSLKFQTVFVVDAHSDVSTALIDNCVNLKPDMYILKTLEHIKTPILISPDAGANKKIFDFYKVNYDRFSDIVYCEKHRDMSTGKIVKTEVYSDDLKGKPCLIVDDICDGGATFIGIAEELKRKNAGDLYLYISHGIFRNGVDELLTYFETIFCTNSFKDIEHENVVQFNTLVTD